MMFTNTTLAKNFGVVGARVHEWTGTTWKSYAWQNAILGWIQANGLELKPGVGYFFQTGTAAVGDSWIQNRPYSWPNND